MNSHLFIEVTECPTNTLKKPIIGLRWVLAILGFLMYFNMFYQRNGFPVALVAMVNGTKGVENPEFANTSGVCVREDKSANDTSNSDYVGEGEYNWTASEQGLILGAFFWGFCFSKLFGSRASEVFGQRGIIGVGITISGILVLLSPLAASMSPYVLAGNRFAIGLAYGPLSSAMHSLLSAWAPPNELSFMVTVVYSGSSLGGTAGLFLTGWLQKSFGWRVSFWLGAGINALFLPFWIILVRNSPKEHPWLTPYEKKLLEANIYVSNKKTVPWFKILSSPYLHICILSHFARCYIDVVLTTEGPSFLSYQIGMTLSAASYVCGAHYLVSAVLVLFMGKLSDLIIEKKWTSKIGARKLFQILGTGVTALILLCVIPAGCNTTVVIILWLVMGATADGTACSYFTSPIDVAPNYTATFSGLMAIGNLGAAITPIVTSSLLQLENGWNKAFYVAAAINIFACAVYVAFMTAEPQSWNFEMEKEKKTKEKNEKKKY